MTLPDPLDGLPRPSGQPAAMQSLAAKYSAAGESLGHTSQALVGMVGRVLAQAWSGQAAMACATACSRDAAAAAAAADAYQIAGSALGRFSQQLALAQAGWDQARRLADEALHEEQHQQTTAMTSLEVPLLLGVAYTSPLRAVARSQAQQGIDDARRAATTAAGGLNDTLAPFRPKPAPAPKPPEHHWYSPVTDFAGGAWDSVKDPVVMVGGLAGLHGDVSDNWSNLGGGLLHGVTHPLDFGKALIDWQDLSNGKYARWGGEIIPSVAAAFFTGGGAAAVKGADGLGAASKTGKALGDLSEAEKATLLSRGEKLVPGAVGHEASAKYLTSSGRLDYSALVQNELKNFKTITSSGTLQLDKDLWLANVHDGTAPLNAGRSLKYSAPLDEVLNHSRGGFMQRLALVPQWGKRTDLSLLHVPAGSTVSMTTGTTAAQMSTHSLSLAGKAIELPMGVKLGGGPQVLLHDVDRQWVVWTGKAPWARPNLVKGVAVGTVTAGTVRVPDVLSDLATQAGH